MKALIITMLFTVILSTGCASGTTQVPNNTWTVTDGLTYKLLLDCYPPSVKEITVVMENQSDMVVRYGEGYYFERFWGGEWHIDNRLNNDRVFNDLGHTLSEYSRNTFTLNLTSTPQQLTSGLYRVTGYDNLDLAPGNRDIWEIEDFEKYPPWQLEFRIQKGAEEEPVEETEKRDWEWYMFDDAYDRASAENVKQLIIGKNGLVAVLINDELSGSIDTDGGKSSMEIFDRKTGSRYGVSLNEITEPKKVEAFKEGFLVDCEYLYYITQNDSGLIDKAVLLRDESGGMADTVIILSEDADEYFGSDAVDITGTYAGKAIVTEADYRKIRTDLNFTRLEVGTESDITIRVFLDETTEQYYIDDVLAERTDLPSGDVLLESTAEYDGSMSLESYTTLRFAQGEDEINGTMTDITSVYGVVFAKESWSITVTKQ